MDALLTLPQIGAFLGAAILITLAPGPDNLMVLGLGLARGRKAGMAFGLGCALGCVNHTLLAALGIGALIAASKPAFAALKIVGGLYLLWLGIQAIRKARAASAARQVGTGSEGSARLFAKGLIANAINPKVILFFLAFLPQFVDAARGSVAWQIAQLGAIFTVQAALIFVAIGGCAGAVGQRLTRTPALGAWLERAAGGIFVLLGVKLIFGR